MALRRVAEQTTRDELVPISMLSSWASELHANLSLLPMRWTKARLPLHSVVFVTRKYSTSTFVVRTCQHLSATRRGSNNGSCLSGYAQYVSNPYTGRSSVGEGSVYNDGMTEDVIAVGPCIKVMSINYVE